VLAKPLRSHSRTEILLGWGQDYVLFEVRRFGYIGTTAHALTRVDSPLAPALAPGVRGGFEGTEILLDISLMSNGKSI